MIQIIIAGVILIAIYNHYEEVRAARRMREFKLAYDKAFEDAKKMKDMSQNQN